MQFDIVLLRLLHIVFSVIWAGGVFALAVIIEPRLRALGPSVQRPFMKAIMPAFVHTMLGSATVAIVSGIFLVLRIRHSSLDSFFDTGWGWAILISFIAAISAYSIGLTRVLPTSKRIIKMGDGIEGRAPTPEEMQQMQALGKNLRMFSRTAMVLIFIALGAMASARFV